MEPDFFVARYAEIGVKGGNRAYFERLLLQNVCTALNAMKYESVTLSSSKVLVKLTKGSDSGKITERLGRVFGIENFSPAVSCKTDYNDMERTAVALAKSAGKKTFRITANRAWKEFPITSQELNKRLGTSVSSLGIKAKMVGADLDIEVDVMRERTLLFIERFPGPGGLPAGSAGRVVCLLSGGIDSPVASWMMMKRGCHPIFVHFYNENLGSPSKIKEITGLLCMNQPPARLWIVPFAECQKAIISHAPGEYRMLLYRRMMMRIAETIAEKEKARALVLGDSLGQVASQTLENMTAVEAAVCMTVFRPLVGMDKKEITMAAQRIGTYNTSIRQYQDCCSFMVPQHPATKSTPRGLERAEEGIEVEKLSEDAMKRAQSLNI